MQFWAINDAFVIVLAFYYQCWMCIEGRIAEISHFRIFARLRDSSKTSRMNFVRFARFKFFLKTLLSINEFLIKLLKKSMNFKHQHLL